MTELEVRGVSVEYAGRRVVDDVSLRVVPGMIVGLVGESGSGKTTIARAIVGSVPLAAGSIALGGVVLGRRRSASDRRAIQLVQQDPFASLNPLLTVGQVLEELLRVHGLAQRVTLSPEVGAQRHALRRRAEELVGLVGLPPDALERYPRQFSGGERQRIAIARALAVEPRVLVADEPTSALDVSVQRTVLDVLSGLAESMDLAVLLISHDLSVIHAVCDDVAVLKDGRLVEHSPAARFFVHPEHPYSRRLLEAVPRLPERGGKGDAPARPETKGDSPLSFRSAGPKGDSPLLVRSTGVPEVGEAVGRITGAFVLGADGVFAQRDVDLDAGLVAAPGAEPDGAEVAASGLWVTPGFVDVHTHLAWSDFDAHGPDPDGARRNRRATLAAGVTTVRDAGGYGPDLARILAGTPGPRVALSIDILGPTDARGARHLRDRVARLADAGATWIKVAATGGVGAGNAQLEPVFAPDEFAAILAAADRAGLPVMVHAWGGPALDQAIDLGARSIEHAVYLTAAQAQRAASAGTFVVPTVWIYADVLRLASEGTLPSTLAPAAQRAVAAHPQAVRHCLEAGVRLAMGTDAGLPSQHGRNLHEVAAMIDAGVPADVALLAATAGGVRLLDPDADAPLTPGAPADLVLFDRNPAVPEALRDPEAVVAVVQGGRVVHRREPDPAA
ncbi:MAG: amidohydrolase family protein [Actinobacteria bacterium]|nr:amidohydrolase family protein [Actinomycetota bacterium]